MTRRQRVTVAVQNRVVILSGTVDTPALKRAVADVARNTGGVLDVCNALHVTHTGTADERPTGASMRRTHHLCEGITRRTSSGSRQ